MQLELLKSEEKEQKIVNVASVPHRSPFRYPGGKTWFVPTFRKWMQSKSKRPNVLLEPFAGGAIISLTAVFENLADKAVIVELDEDVASVWQAIFSKDNSALCKKIVDFKMTSETVQKTFEKKPKNTLEQAFQTIIRNRVSHGGIMAPGSGLIKSGENGKGLTSRWYPQTLAKRISEIENVKDRLTIIHGSAFDVIPDYSGSPKNAIFIDPPYTAGGKKAGQRLYRHHEMDHAGLFDLMDQSKADFLFTYDESDELKSLAQRHGFDTALIAMKNTHHAKMDELIVGRNLTWLKEK